MRIFKCCLVITHRKPIVEPGREHGHEQTAAAMRWVIQSEIYISKSLSRAPHPCERSGQDGGGMSVCIASPRTHRRAQELAPVRAQVEEHPSPGAGQGGPADQQDEEDEVGQRGRHPHHLQRRRPSAPQHPHCLRRALPRRPCPEFRQPGELPGARCAPSLLRGPTTEGMLLAPASPGLGSAGAGPSHLAGGFHPFPQAEVDDGEDEEEAEEQLPADPPHIVQTAGLLDLQDLPPVAGQGLRCRWLCAWARWQRAGSPTAPSAPEQRL